MAAEREKKKGAAAAKEAAGGRIITLESSSGEVCRVSEAVASLSGLISRAIEEGCANNVVVKLPNVAARTLDTVLEYCNMHAGPGAAPATKPDSAPTAAAAGGSSSSSSVDTAAAEDRKFFDVLSLNALHDLLIAANDLEIERLLDAICHKVAGMIKGKTPDEIRATFNIVNDLTPAAEAELRHKYAWAFDE
ncbi:SKP1-like protein 1B [Panicum miliaceum]|uniref:SKP1-like protein n=1 Tax=Panicum miliaceum TaxID=4540 RepID=A0A3L6QQU2_PANMI|nr:SKP1-like protein 1B [Panicum miliaceum]